MSFSARDPWLALAASAIVAGCAEQPPLNSDRIADRYGSYSLAVLQQDAEWRVSSLASLHDGREVTRTLALTRYLGQVPPELLDVDRRVRAGASIGASFRAAGCSVEKVLLHTGSLRIDASAGLARLMALQLPAELAVHVYRFDCAMDGKVFPYATIAELHHPDYLDQRALEALYGSRPGSGTGEVAELLRRVREVVAELPEAT